MIQPLFEHRLTLAGYDTRVLEPEGDGEPIVMLHGYADSADTWRQALALARGRNRPQLRQRRQVVAKTAGMRALTPPLPPARTRVGYFRRR